MRSRSGEPYLMAIVRNPYPKYSYNRITYKKWEIHITQKPYNFVEAVAVPFN